MEQLQASFRKGETLWATAERVKCSPGTVHAWFQRFKQGRIS
jgi:hypothetical protein